MRRSPSTMQQQLQQPASQQQQQEPNPIKEFIGRAVSIHCSDELGVFQGTIRTADADSLTIVRAFRNGLPVRTLDTEITIKASDIVNLQLIPNTYDTRLPQRRSPKNGQRISNHNNNNNTTNIGQNNGPEMVAMLMNNTKLNGSNNGFAVQQHQPHLLNGSRGSPSMRPNQLKHSPITVANNQRYNASTSFANGGSFAPPNNTNHQHVQKHFGNMIPSKVEVRLGSASTTAAAQSNVVTPQKNVVAAATAAGTGAQSQQRTASNRKTAAYARNHAFAQNADDPSMLGEEFDFEKNLALFDKAAIWDEIDAIQKPDLMRQTAFVQPKNYRHDENVLPSMPAMSARQIRGNSNASGGGGGGGAASTAIQVASASGSSCLEFCTDDGLVIPTVPLAQRRAVQLAAQNSGLMWSRQCDMLARGTAELALMLLGGARRLTPQNRHQWPTIVVVTDAEANSAWTDAAAEAGLATGRHLASHGLKVCVYGRNSIGPDGGGAELALFRACGEDVAISGRTRDLPPTCDLVILAVRQALKSPIAKYVNESRSPTLAIDPPIAIGASAASLRVLDVGVPIKHSILPLLPLNGIDGTHAGKLYLCNLGIPERFYTEAGIKYRSPFGHKFVIPIHPMTAAEQNAAKAIASSV